MQNSNIADASQVEAYPEPIEEAVATEEPTPAPEVEPTQGPQPTSGVVSFTPLIQPQSNWHPENCNWSKCSPSGEGLAAVWHPSCTG